MLATVGAVALLAAALFAAATLRLFVWPPSDRPTPADAVVALGGDPGQHRAAEAMALARSGYAPVAVISLGGTPPAPCPKAARAVEVLCFRPDPLDTRGEAEHIARLVAARHWRKIIVVPERSQATRARLLVERCTGVRLEIVPVADPLSQLPEDLLYEWGALAKALVLERTC